MSVVFAVCPWIVYAIASSFTSVAVAALVSGATALLLIGLRAARGVHLAETTIDSASAAFFFAASAGCAATGSDLIGRFLGAGSELWLALVVAAGLAVGRPFTEPIARRQAPPEFSGTAGFREFNAVITRVWLCSFLAAGLLILVSVVVLGPQGQFATYVLIPLSILVPVRYTAHLVRKVRPDAASA
ncbi:hypothetical protein [Nocardia carnea]|uniref:hypothetical protein n=1 Tax=Nocardia carnea TaxID=37328 RepID=UPI002458A4B8|nr:hypothetical protein [Nocardia carnea]